jgi:hypothetical protein
MNKKTVHIIFIIFAILALGALVFHVKEIFYPTTTTKGIISLYVLLRHAVFVLINGICIYGIVKRPKWFIGCIGLLTIQQWYSHGTYAIAVWQTLHKIDWISVGVILLMPILFILLIFDSKKNKP